jgi:hypothetical protein
MTMTRTTTVTDVTAIDAQIAEAERELTMAQTRYRSRPHQGAMLGQGLIRIDRKARAHMFALGWTSIVKPFVWRNSSDSVPRRN